MGSELAADSKLSQASELTDTGDIATDIWFQNYSAEKGERTPAALLRCRHSFTFHLKGFRQVARDLHNIFP
jgi:hypothetical protein